MRKREFEDPFKGEHGCFLITTDHLERQLVFRSDEDFIYGVNSLAIGTLRHPVRLLCYVLMDNHLHILISGAYRQCLAYSNWILHRLSLMLKKRYGVSGLLREEAVDIRPVIGLKMFMNEVAYVIRNPYKARICSPLSYRWSSGKTYFNPDLVLIRGEPLQGVDAVRTLLQTRIRIPSHWEHADGRILDKFFVCYQYVEEQFGNSLVYFDRLRKYNLESILASSHGAEETLTFSDREMQEKIGVICRNEYHVASYHQLDRKTLLVLARALSRRFSCPQKQIGRLLGLDVEWLDRIL